MADKVLKYREMIACVSKFGVHENASRGKGSHRMLEKLIDGRIERFPVPCHNENHELAKSFIRAIRRRFKLTDDDGVSDTEFYG